MGNCKNCKYWTQEYIYIDFYNENFGECTHKKVIDRDDIPSDNNDKKNTRFNNYDIIYSSDEGSEVCMHKDFGCINFEER